MREPTPESPAPWMVALAGDIEYVGETLLKAEALTLIQKHAPPASAPPEER